MKTKSRNPISHRRAGSSRQRGGLPFKTLAMLGGLGVAMVVVLIIATAPPPRPDGAANSTNQSANGQTTDQSKKAGGDSGGDTKQPALVRLPDGFRRFTNKEYDISVAYPAAWGSLLSRDNFGGSRLQAATKTFTQRIGAAQASGSFTVSIYPANRFEISTKPGSQVVAPVKQDNKVVWKVTRGQPTDAYRVGNSYPLGSYTTPSRLTVYDFSWTIDGNLQSRWVYAAGDYYILMTLPPLTGANGAQPAPADLAFYKRFAESIIDTLQLPD